MGGFSIRNEHVAMVGGSPIVRMAWDASIREERRGRDTKSDYAAAPHAMEHHEQRDIAGHTSFSFGFTKPPTIGNDVLQHS